MEFWSKQDFFFRERQLLQAKAKQGRAQSPSHDRESVKKKLKYIKTLAPVPKISDTVTPDSPPPLPVLRPAPGRPRPLASLPYQTWGCLPLPRLCWATEPEAPSNRRTASRGATGTVSYINPSLTIPRVPNNPKKDADNCEACFMEYFLRSQKPCVTKILLFAFLEERIS